MISKTIRVKILQEGTATAIPVPFEPKQVFGKVRAPVKVTLNGYTFRSTIASMGGRVFVPLRRSNREAAGVEGGQRLEVRLELDESPRVVKVPADLAKALKAAPGAFTRWKALSFTHQREHVEAIESAKKPETRARRIGQAVDKVAAATTKGK